MFQNEIQQQQALGVTGDFATNNPMSVWPSIEAGFAAGNVGIQCGTFVWIQPDRRFVLNFGSGSPDGFIAREQQGLITDYLSVASMFIPSGFMVTVFRTGDFYVVNNVNASVVGDKCFASNLNGTIMSAPSGSIIPNYSETNFVIRGSADINELALISYNSIFATTSLPWVDSFGSPWEDEFGDPWVT